MISFIANIGLLEHWQFPPQLPLIIVQILNVIVDLIISAPKTHVLFLGHHFPGPGLASLANNIFILAAKAHEVFDHEDQEHAGEEDNGLILGDDIPDVDDEGDIDEHPHHGDPPDDIEPDPYRFHPNRQGAFAEVYYLVFFGVQGHHPIEEHHDVEEGHNGRKQDQSSKRDHYCSVALPGPVDLIRVHVGLHFVLFLVKAVDGLKVVQVVGNVIVLVLFVHVPGVVEHKQWLECHDDSQQQVQDHGHHQLVGNVIVAVGDLLPRLYFY